MISAPRFWLACLAVLAAFWLCPPHAIELGAILFFFPNCVCCGEIACVCCNAGTPHLDYQIVVAGVVNDACADCDQANDTFVVTQAAPDSCNWIYTLDPDICAYEVLQLTLVCGFLMTPQYAVSFTNGGSTEQISWNNIEATDPFDCDFSATDVSDVINRVGNDCENAAATCTVTAL